MEKNNLVISVLGCGIVLEIIQSEREPEAKVWWVRNVFKFQEPEWIPVQMLEQGTEPCTLADIEAEIEERRKGVEEELTFFRVLLKEQTK